MRILAIDPGNTESAYAVIEMPEFKLIEFDKLENETLKNGFKHMKDIDVVAIEMVGCYGMPVGKDVFETCVWIGKFSEALPFKEQRLVYRKNEKRILCEDSRAKDSNIRQALINRYAKHDFRSGRGVKKNPDTFYGVANDVWQAIAVGVTCYEEGAEEGVF